MSEYKGNIQIHYPEGAQGLTKASGGVKSKKLLVSVLVAGLFGGILVAGGYIEDLNWLKITGYCVGGVFLLGGVGLSLSAKVSSCPYCHGEIGKTIDDTISKLDENEKIVCPHCLEYLISHEGELRAFQSVDVAHTKHIMAPVFENGKWPDECIICGETVVKYEQAKNTKLNAEQLLIGRLSVSWGSVDNIPYCATHGGEVEMKIKDDYMYVKFSELDMMKRYLAVNQANFKHKVKIQGQLEKILKGKK